MSDPLTEVRFWMQVLVDSERTIICSPENESRIKGWIDARNCGGVLKVQVETFVPDDQIFVMDHNAISASAEQMFMRPWSMGA